MPDNMGRLFDLSPEHIAAQKNVLLSDAYACADRLRVFSENQVNFWKRIPWLALQAQQRNPNQRYELAYKEGLWNAEPSESGYRVLVDLATGKLLDAHALSDLEEADHAANAQDILYAFMEDPTCFSAPVIIRDLERINQRSIENYHAMRVAELADALGIGEMYERRKTIPRDLAN
jgi:hypothetical protein